MSSISSSIAAFVPLLAPEAGARWLDLVGLSLVLLFLVLGAMRGLWWQLVRLLGVVAVVSVARALAPRLAPGLQGAFSGLHPQVASGIVWLAILLAGFVAVSLIGRIGKATIVAAQLSLVDRTGGAIAGALSGLIVHAAILLVLCLLTSRTWSQSAVRGTHSASLLDTLGRGVPLFLDVQAAEVLRPALPAPTNPR